MTDDHGVITDVVFRDVNDRFEKIMRREDCIGKPASQLFPDSIGLFIKENTLAKQTGEPVNFQHYFPPSRYML